MSRASGRIMGQITWVYAEDLGQTIPFYRDVLGLRIDRDSGAAMIFETAPGAFVGVCEAFDDRVVEPKGGMITLLVEDVATVDAWYQRMVDAGAIPMRAPEKMERFGIYSFFCRDPNGYVIEMQTFL
ncbi:VOC family protein [Shimia aestuarii]|nr:VOC family protein [Shimia aestuarii]